MIQHDLSPTAARLSVTQKRQVTLLYHFASLDYLKGFQTRLRDFMQFINPRLDKAALERRDELLRNGRLKKEDAWDNGIPNGWSFLANFDLSVSEQIIQHALDVYSITGMNFYARAFTEFSLQWMIPDEKNEYPSRLEDLEVYSGNIDNTVDKHGIAGRWDDFCLTLEAQRFADVFANANELRLRLDITSQSGMVPPRTGVYLPLDDPHGTPQFCWTGEPSGELKKCSTFNDLGLEALASVGREALWLDDYCMNQFVQSHLQDPLLRADPYFKDSVNDPELAASLVARQAFTSRSCEWVYVEQLHGQPIDWSENPSHAGT
ncbi:hypothetical protein J2S30_002956 [Herbaspirillum rubrisubalbicans]|uniref:hypothetical protein n=1 Tax=Herbaspirillum rubrisubalbicans TaxID=80842 RepID=UPI0020A1273C|nr:hypothetical protein [Herbaspirillum rubrisubalbicans]MCP1574577.1 hypothetical protein [Herbaspirillum rubrisubalbicans]